MVSGVVIVSCDFVWMVQCINVLYVNPGYYLQFKLLCLL